MIPSFLIDEKDLPWESEKVNGILLGILLKRKLGKSR